MTSDLVELLTCPVDGASPLRLTSAAAPGSDPIETGSLTCPECGREYPIAEGIPCLLPDPSLLPRHEAEEKERERNQRDREAGIYDRNRSLRLLSLAEIPATLRRLQPQRSDTVLEIGCGTGRFTRHLAARCRRVVAVDYSRESLRRARAKIPQLEVQFLQADASFLPLAERSADRALSCQMLEHLPTPEARERALAGIARALRPGGRVVVSAYWHSPFTRWFGEREGHHSDAIYFYRFDRREFQALLQPWFEVESLTGALIYILLARGSRRANPGTA
jgi:ubiquinone/menaquinone biosynthesis C-methylase UbiE